VLGKSTLATAQGVTTHYDQSVTRAADITGTLWVAGMPSLACTEGTITQSRSVTIVAPGPTAPVPFSLAQQISPRDWKSLVTQPWRDTTLLVKSIGLTKLRGSAR
jgi:hypothetical protein